MKNINLIMITKGKVKEFGKNEKKIGKADEINILFKSPTLWNPN